MKKTNQELKEKAMKNGTRKAFYYPNGNIYTGEWKNDLMDGNGTFHFKNGLIYTGEFSKGYRQGKGSLSAPVSPPNSKISSTNINNTNDMRKVYVGEWMNDEYHGLGVFYYPDGSVYEGEFENGMKNGRGRMLCANGDVYDGQWKNDARHGHGIMKQVTNDGDSCGNGGVYDGEWKDDLKHGKGMFKYNNRDSVYEGEWEKNIPKTGQITTINHQHEFTK